MAADPRKNIGIIGNMLGAAGIVVLLLALYQASEQFLILKSWTPVTAQFVKSDVVNDKIYSTIETARADNYLVRWTFRYEVGGVVHTSTSDPGVHGTYSEMLKWNRRFSPGQTVTIHYKPDNPDVISASAYDWITFQHAARTAAWGAGILVVGLVLRSFRRKA